MSRTSTTDDIFSDVEQAIAENKESHTEQDSPLNEENTMSNDTSTEQNVTEQDSEEQVIQASLAEFESAVDAIIEAASDTGQLEDGAAEAAVEAYRQVEGGQKGKNQAKLYMTEGMKASLNPALGAAGFPRAQAWNLVQDAVLNAPTKTARPAAAPVDQAQVYADKVAALRLAVILAEANAPDEADGWEAKVTFSREAADELIEMQDGTLPEEHEATYEAGAVERAAVKMAAAKSPTRSGRTSTFTGVRRNVATHILNAFETVESGEFMTIAEIRGVPSDEYGDDAPSAGAISARLFPTSGKPCSVEGIEPGQDESEVRGAFKA